MSSEEYYKFETQREIYLLWAEWFVETMSGSQENSLNNIDGLINRLNPEHVDKAEYIVSSKLPVSVTIISQSYNN